MTVTSCPCDNSLSGVSGRFLKLLWVAILTREVMRWKYNRKVAVGESGNGKDANKLEAKMPVARRGSGGSKMALDFSREEDPRADFH
jgi:hypothetical protein